MALVCFPPLGNPPAKRPMLTLLKQARAFGLGCVLVTQNPVDLDYKGLTNAGTWFIGKLQAERDDMARSALRADALDQENAFLREQLEFASAVSLDIQRSRELVEELTAQNKALQQTVRALSLDAKRTPATGATAQPE